MAKSQTRTAANRTAAPTAAPERGVESTLAAYAESLGTALGHLRNHVDNWKGQRQHLVTQLSTMVSDAQGLLADLGHSAAEKVSKVRRGRKPKKFVKPDSNPAGALKPVKRGRKKGLSEAGREKISTAQKERWAAYRTKRST